MLNKMMKKFHNKKGFTMIELIAVMAVIAVLVTILLPQVSALRERAVKTEAVKVAKEVFQAVQAYELENADVPKSLADLKQGGYNNDSGRDEAITSIAYSGTDTDLDFTYELKKGKVHVEVTYDNSAKTFTTVITNDGTLSTTGILPATTPVTP